MTFWKEKKFVEIEGKLKNLEIQIEATNNRIDIISSAIANLRGLINRKIQGKIEERIEEEDENVKAEIEKLKEFFGTG